MGRSGRSALRQETWSVMDDDDDYYYYYYYYYYYSYPLFVLTLPRLLTIPNKTNRWPIHVVKNWFAVYGNQIISKRMISHVWFAFMGIARVG